MRETGIKEQLKDISESLKEIKEKEKPKEWKLPFFSRLSKTNLKKSYITVCIINDNRALDFKKVPVIDGVIELEDTLHALNEYSIYTYNGKPFIFQPKKKLNPYDFLDKKNETYGQKYILARMERGKIENKKQIPIQWILGGLAVVGIAIYFLTK